MKRLTKMTFLFTAIGLLVLNCATETKEEPLYYEDGIVNLNGPWGENMKAEAVTQHAEFTAKK